MSKFFTLISCLALSFVMRVNAADNQPPTVVNLIPSAGSTVRSLVQIEVFFSEDVTGVDAGDLLINGVAADSVDVFTASQYVFNFPQPPAGVVQVAWSPDHAIQDLATPTPNNFAGGNWTYLLDTNVTDNLLINEFMAANNKTIHDEDGDSSDWIEIYNPTAAPVSVGL
jgi:hypothetical protein